MPSFEEVMEAQAAEAATTAHAGPTPQQIAAFMRESARGAAVLTELLDTPAWNIFRSVIGGDLRACEAERAVLRDQMESGSLVGDERARADLRLQYLRGAIEKLRRAMELPKDLVDRHARLEKAASGPVGEGRILDRRAPDVTCG